MTLVAPFGFYGWGNIGDECTLQGFARLMSVNSPDMRAWVASRNPAHTARVAPSLKYFSASGLGLRRRWAQFSAQAYVMPGGTPIMDVLGDWPLNEVAGVIASARQKPVVFIGTGTERLKHDRSREIVARDLAPHVVRWTVRSSRDKERLVEYGVPAQRVTEAADLAWTLEPVTPDFGRDRLRELGVDLSHGVVGVNVNREPHMMLSAPSLLEELAGGLDRIISDSGASVIFLCNEVRDGESFDRATSETVLAAMKQRNRAHLVPNHYYTPQEMQSFIGCCATTISTRYHFCLLSAVQRVPFVALKRSDKVDDLCFDLQWPFGKRLEDVTASSLLDQFHGVASQRPELEGLLAERTGVLRERSLTNAVALEALRA